MAVSNNCRAVSKSEADALRVGFERTAQGAPTLSVQIVLDMPEFRAGGPLVGFVLRGVATIEGLLDETVPLVRFHLIQGSRVCSGVRSWDGIPMRSLPCDCQDAT